MKGNRMIKNLEGNHDGNQTINDLILSFYFTGIINLT